MKTLRIIKDSLLVLSALIALLFLIVEINDMTPFGSIGETIGTIVSGAWLTLFGYAQYSK